ncbi:MAG: MBL fold metallo-hydrolase, partial [Ruminococcus sp.]|nr:MBL fold metallo-hydrolase [Ruminococcus sp.]
IVSYLEENNIKSVDYLIITHYDKDHVGGASKVIKNTEVKNILAPDYQEDSKEFEKYMKSADDKGITPVLVTDDFSFTVDGVDYTVYAPKKAYSADSDDNDDNYFSLVTKAVYKDNSFVFTGDAIYQRLEEVMNIGDCDLLKIPYHARKIDNLGQFLENTKPEYAVACTSESEFADETKSLLNDYNITYYATCYNGNITVTSDGHSIKIKTEK